jgi:iron complex outermembrane receptor protein
MRLARLLAAACAVSAPCTARAADTNSAASVAELVVTAEKREARSADVAASLLVIAGEEIERHPVSLSDIASRTPGLRFGSGISGGENAIVLRGVGVQNITAGGDSPVAYSVDGIYLARTTSLDPEFFDVERIEVLRGPQGTLDGRNAVGGAIHVISRGPTPDLSAALDVGVGSHGMSALRGWVNGPLLQGSDIDASARFSFAAVRPRDPLQDNRSGVAGATNRGDAQNYLLARFSLNVGLGMKSQLRLVGAVAEDRAPVATKVRYELAPDRYGSATAYDPDPRTVSKDAPERLDKHLGYVSAMFTSQVGPVGLTNILGYAGSRWSQSSDSDGSDAAIAVLEDWRLRSEQVSNELRLTSITDGPLQWVAGVFLFREKVDQAVRYRDTGLAAASPFTGPYTLLSGGAYVTESWAGFGEVVYAPPGFDGRLKLTAGVRRTVDRKRGVDYFDLDFTRANFVLSPRHDFNETWSATTYRLRAAYDLGDGWLGYVSHATGYLSGGGLLGSPSDLYRPERVRAYEAGLKGATSRLDLNVALYRQELRDMQVLILDVAGSRIENAGRAHVQGLELEAVGRPAEGWRFTVSGVLTEAEYDRYVTVNPRRAGSAPEDLSGKRLVQTPRYAVALTARRTLSFRAGELGLELRAYRSGDIYFLSANAPYDRQPPYTLLDASLDWRLADGRSWVQVFVRNLTNRDVISNDSLAPSTNGEGTAVDTYTYYPPRLVGVRIGRSF